MSSVLIRNGLVVDGTGREAIPADVLVEGDHITDVLPRPGCPASPGCPVSPVPHPPSQLSTIDASGCLVTPGFIDAHAHSDTYLLNPMPPPNFRRASPPKSTDSAAAAPCRATALRVSRATGRR